MKKNIHPKWHKDARTICACGNIFTIGSTVPEVRVEVCAKCHPFYTGEQKFIDTLGRVEKFQQKTQIAKKHAPALAKKRAKKERRGDEDDQAPKSLKEMLQVGKK